MLLNLAIYLCNERTDSNFEVLQSVLVDVQYTSSLEDEIVQFYLNQQHILLKSRHVREAENRKEAIQSVTNRVSPNHKSRNRK